LKGAGLLDSNLPPGFSIPEPNDSVLLTPDEDPLDGDDAEEVEDPPSDAEPPLTEEEPPEEDREPLQFSPQVFSLLRQGQA
jgi:segregation and condensation protein B